RNLLRHRLGYRRRYPQLQRPSPVAEQRSVVLGLLQEVGARSDLGPLGRIHGPEPDRKRYDRLSANSIRGLRARAQQIRKQEETNVENIMSSKLLTTRRGTIFLGVGAAVLAAIVLLVYLNQYRNSVDSGAQPVSVLVAKSLIQKGTPGDVVGSTELFQVSSIPRKQVKTGAYVDPLTLKGK